MEKLNRPLGCGIWLVWLLLALFTAEWLLLWYVMREIPREQLPLAVLAVVILTIIGGSGTIYFRVQRRIP